jgi:plasmid stabilization system protein ParE
MRLRYTVDALAHLEAINDFLSERNPAAARRVIADIRQRHYGFVSFLTLAAEAKYGERTNGWCKDRLI